MCAPLDYIAHAQALGNKLDVEEGERISKAHNTRLLFNHKIHLITVAPVMEHGVFYHYVRAELKLL